MKLAFDVMGSDNKTPKNAIIAVIRLLIEFDDIETITLVGDFDLIKTELFKLTKNKRILSKIIIKHADDEIKMNDSIINALKKNENSSMGITTLLLKQKLVDGILTSGSTGAYLALCRANLSFLKNINKPAFMPIMPTTNENQSFLLLDVGANVENSVDELVKFALMGHVYAQKVLKIKNPKVALLNIGEEQHKGTVALQEAYQLLMKLTANNGALQQINFCGNIEPRKLFSGEADVIVCNGYTGNITLKCVEGTFITLFKVIKNWVTSNIFKKIIFGLILRKMFKGIEKKFNYKNVGGAQLIGINGICFKAHGSSDAKSYYSTLKLLREAVLKNVNEQIKIELENLAKSYEKNKS